MKEIRFSSSSWSAPVSRIIPTENLTPGEKKKLTEREELIKRAVAEGQKPDIWLKINNGIFKDTIFKNNNNDTTIEIDCYREVLELNDRRTLYSWELEKSHTSKEWKFAESYLRLDATIDWHSPHVIRLPGGSIHVGMVDSSVFKGLSLLLDYDGPEVFSQNTTIRPMTFRDRLDQDVTVGDLVVVALNQGAGLDICTVRGFCDETRVWLESVEDKMDHRIALTKNATNKIMRMPNTLKDTALMLKLAS